VLAVMLLMIIVSGSGTMYISSKAQNRLHSTLEQDAKSGETITDLMRRAGLVHSNILLHLFHGSAGDMDQCKAEIDAGVGKIS